VRVVLDASLRSKHGHRALVPGIHDLAPLEQLEHGARRLPERDVVGARVVQGLCDGILVVAGFAAAKAIAAAPRQLGALDVDAARACGIERRRHLAPRRQRLARLLLRDHARRPA
jgi:hypothetical protein